MTRFQASIDLKATPEAVFAYVSDLTRHSEWAGNRLLIEPLTGATSGRGARFQSRGRQGGIDVLNELTITEYGPPHRFAFEAAGREGRMLHTFTLAPVEGGVRLTKAMEVLNTRPVLRLATPLFALTVLRNLAKDLRRIKARLEA
jgi:uncharacterized protein YndB with AHSA1/START domain